MKKRKNLPVIIYLLALCVLLYGVMHMASLSSQALSYSDIVELFENEQVKSFIVRDNMIRLELHEPLNGETDLQANLANPESFRAEMTPPWALMMVAQTLRPMPMFRRAASP